MWTHKHGVGDSDFYCGNPDSFFIRFLNEEIKGWKSESALKCLEETSEIWTIYNSKVKNNSYAIRDTIKLTAMKSLK